MGKRQVEFSKAVKQRGDRAQADMLQETGATEALRVSGESAAGELVERKINGRKPDDHSTGAFPHRRVKEVVDSNAKGPKKLRTPKAHHVEAKRVSLGQAFADLEEHGLPTSEATRHLYSKGGSRVPRPGS